MREGLSTALSELYKIAPKDLADQRYEKFRKMGSFFSESSEGASA
jgi:acetyl-CoA carboxylase alpha subunit